MEEYNVREAGQTVYLGGWGEGSVAIEAGECTIRADE